MKFEIFRVRVEPIDDAFSRFNKEYDEAHQGFHLANAVLKDYAKANEGNENLVFPGFMVEAADKARNGYRKMRLMEVKAQRPRNVEVVIFNKRMNFTIVKQFEYGP